MSQQWYYSKNGQRQGPVAAEQLKTLAATGQLQATDLIWKEGMGQWTEAKKVKGLFPVQGTANSQLPPPIPSAPNIPPVPATGTTALDSSSPSNATATPEPNTLEGCIRLSWRSASRNGTHVDFG